MPELDDIERREMHEALLDRGTRDERERLQEKLHAMAEETQEASKPPEEWVYQ